MVADAAPAGSMESHTGRVLRIRGLRIEGALARCITDVEDIMVPRVPATFLRSGDEIRVGSLNTPVAEFLATQNSIRRKARQICFGHIGYVTQPKADKRDEYFVRAEVPESSLGIRALHLPNAVVRDYFYFFAPDRAARAVLRFMISCAHRREAHQPICVLPIESAASS